MPPFLDRYLTRIGLAGPLPADLDTLRAITAAHTRAVPFENLDPFTGRDVDLAPDALDAKLVRGGRGGYCFEQNGVLRRALDDLGFTTTPLLARVTMGRGPDDPTPPRTHLVVRVDLASGPHLVDVGFGGRTPTGVLALDDPAPQPTPHGPYRVTPAEGGVLVLASLTGSPRELYRIEPGPASASDVAMANFWTSRHPRSGFVTGLAAARAEPDRRFALSDTRLAVHHVGGPSETRELADVRALREALETTMRIDTSGLPDLDAHLARLYRSHADARPSSPR